MLVNEKSMINLFDSAALDFVNSMSKYGEDNIITIMEREQAFGILRALQRLTILEPEMVGRVIDCLYGVKGV